MIQPPRVCCLCGKGFVDAPSLWNHCRSEHHSWAEARKRMLWEAQDLHAIPLLPQGKRRIIHNFTDALYRCTHVFSASRGPLRTEQCLHEAAHWMCNVCQGCLDRPLLLMLPVPGVSCRAKEERRGYGVSSWNLRTDPKRRFFIVQHCYRACNSSKHCYRACFAEQWRGVVCSHVFQTKVLCPHRKLTQSQFATPTCAPIYRIPAPWTPNRHLPPPPTYPTAGP